MISTRKLNYCMDIMGLPRNSGKTKLVGELKTKYSFSGSNDEIIEQYYKRKRELLREAKRIDKKKVL